MDCIVIIRNIPCGRCVALGRGELCTLPPMRKRGRPPSRKSTAHAFPPPKISPIAIPAPVSPTTTTASSAAVIITPTTTSTTKTNEPFEKGTTCIVLQLILLMPSSVLGRGQATPTIKVEIGEEEEERKRKEKRKEKERDDDEVKVIMKRKRGEKEGEANQDTIKRTFLSEQLSRVEEERAAVPFSSRLHRDVELLVRERLLLRIHPCWIEKPNAQALGPPLHLSSEKRVTHYRRHTHDTSPTLHFPSGQEINSITAALDERLLPGLVRKILLAEVCAALLPSFPSSRGLTLLSPQLHPKIPRSRDPFFDPAETDLESKIPFLKEYRDDLMDHPLVLDNLR